MATILTIDQAVDVTVSFVDRAGNPAKVDGVPAWSSSDDTVVTVTPAADGLSAVVSSTDKIGTAQVVVRADADLDAGESREIMGSLDLETVGGEAMTASISAGAPHSKT